jgi:tetratricopeptide (TPR) repeat protein
MDAGIASGSRYLALEGAKGLLRLGSSVRDDIRERAAIIVQGKRANVRSPEPALDENIPKQLHKKIYSLKRALSDAPRNALGHLEIARLYCRLGQFEKSEYHLTVAVRLAPEDRFVLRAATRFFTIVDESRLALRILRSADSLKVDPWLQSAELAAAELIGAHTQWAHRGAKRALGLKKLGPAQSELLTGWATRKSDEGLGRRQTFRILERTIGTATENAFAQAVWLIDSTDGDFKRVFPHTGVPPGAHEAESLILYEQGDYFTARSETALWFADQPFQVRAAIQLASINYIHFENYEDSLWASERGLVIHPSEWVLLNIAAISSIQLGDISNARRHLRAFDKLVGSEEQQAYRLAALGMLNLAEGRHDEGVAKYDEAIRVGRRARRKDLMVNAAMYMMESMARAGLIQREEFDRCVPIINQAIRNLDGAVRRDAERSWKSRERIVRALTDKVSVNAKTLSLDKQIGDAQLDF